MQYNGSRGPRGPTSRRSGTTSTRISVGTSPLAALPRIRAWLSLKITVLTLALHVGEGSTHVQSFSLDGRPDAQAGQWLSEQLGARGLDAHALNAPSPYEMPAHAVSQGAAYGPADFTDALAELAAWFGNAGL